jgi:hypothetical protein
MYRETWWCNVWFRWDVDQSSCGFSACGPTWSGHFEDKKITDVFFYVPNIPTSTRIHGASLCQRRCLGDLFWRCFPVGWMFCRAGLKLFRTSLRGLQCHIGPSSMLSRHYTGSKLGKITDKITPIHEFWLVPTFSLGYMMANCPDFLNEMSQLEYVCQHMGTKPSSLQSIMLNLQVKVLSIPGDTLSPCTTGLPWK